MRRNDATSPVTPLKRMLECAERQAPMEPFYMNKFMDDLYELIKKRQ